MLVTWNVSEFLVNGGVLQKPLGILLSVLSKVSSGKMLLTP